jgi:hypothetical protein
MRCVVTRSTEVIDKRCGELGLLLVQFDDAVQVLHTAKDAIRHIRVHALLNGLGPDIADTGLERGFGKPLHRSKGRRQRCGKEHFFHDDQGLAQAG